MKKKNAWLMLPPYMVDGKPGNRFPVGYITDRNADGSPAAYRVPIEIVGDVLAAHVVAALNGNAVTRRWVADPSPSVIR